jgi:FAD synthetase
MQKVMVFGTFDVLHPGHLNFLESAKKFGDRLIVVLARDKFVQRVKGRPARLSEKERLEMIKALKVVDEAMLGDADYRYERTIAKLKPDVICLGYDQKETPKEMKRALGKKWKRIKIYRLKAYKPTTYKSSLIKG